MINCFNTKLEAFIYRFSHVLFSPHYQCGTKRHKIIAQGNKTVSNSQKRNARIIKINNVASQK